MESLQCTPRAAALPQGMQCEICGEHAHNRICVCIYIYVYIIYMYIQSKAFNTFDTFDTFDTLSICDFSMQGTSA